MGVNRPVSAIFTVILMMIAFGFVSAAYFLDQGKVVLGESLACLCHSEGVQCINAQVLGGIANMMWTNAKMISYTKETGDYWRAYVIALFLALAVYTTLMRMQSIKSNDTEMALLDTDD